ncbi:MAG: PQQ-dependent sugar dehydrogenase, partial [Thermodesulfobacteriota bacterium]
EVDWQSGDSSGGENYGWRCMEGKECTGLSGCTCNSPELTIPIFDYTHSGGNCAIMGGYVYRGAAIPDIEGTYFFADFCTGEIWSFVRSGNTVSQFKDRTLEFKPITGETINNVTSFGEDDNGEIYIVDKDGEVFKIVDKSTLPVPTPAPTPIPPAPTPTPTSPPSGNAVLSAFTPGTAGTWNTITVTGAPSRATVKFYYATTTGTTSFTRGVCKGKALGLSRPALLGSVRADTSGKATFSVNLASTLGGRTVYMQSSAETTSTCAITNRVSQKINMGAGGSTQPGWGFRLTPR